MSITTIGIQTIMPTTGTPQQQPQPANDNAPASAQQAPPPPGLGKLMDKTV